MTVYAKQFKTRQTPQSEPIPGKAMVENSAGGYSFAVDRWTRLNRFLVLGSEGGSFYASEKKLTVENAKCVMECANEDVRRTVDTIVAISDAGRAPKNDAAIFALAIVASMVTPFFSTYVAPAIPKVCRIGTHILQFAECVKGMRGWGRGLRRAIGAWYTSKSADDLAYQLVKYQNREGWRQGDLLRVLHVPAPSPEHAAVMRWAIGGIAALGERSVKPKPGSAAEPRHYPSVAEHLPAIIHAVEEAKTADDQRICALIREYNLPRECVPTEKLNSVAVWEALLERMPPTALLRNLGKMTQVGLLKPLSAASRHVCERLGSQEALRAARVHPLAVLIALKTYGSGHGLKGSLSWTPVSQVNDALDAAFYLAFGAVEPAGKRTLMGLDVSGSMSCALTGTPISCAEGAAAMAMVMARTEPQYELMAFADSFRKLDISRCSRLADVVKLTQFMNFGATDCSLPMTWALQNEIEVDTFQVYTDSETWVGCIQPCQALVQYRQKMGIPARLVVVGMVSNGFSIADPSDGGMLDVVGFDTAAPAVINGFSRGDI